MTELEGDDCPLCEGTGEVAIVDKGDYPCPSCAAASLRATLASLGCEETETGWRNRKAEEEGRSDA